MDVDCMSQTRQFIESIRLIQLIFPIILWHTQKKEEELLAQLWSCDVWLTKCEHTIRIENPCLFIKLKLIKNMCLACKLCNL